MLEMASTQSFKSRDHKVGAENYIDSTNRISKEIRQLTKEQTSSKLYGPLRPMTITMKIFGLYFLSKTSLPKSCQGWFLCGYSLLKMAFLWGVLFWKIWKIHTLGGMKSLEDFLENGSTLISLFYISILDTSVVVMCARKNGLRHFFDIHGIVEKDLWNESEYSNLRKRIYIYTTIGCSVMLIVIGITLYLSFPANQMADELFPWYFVAFCELQRIPSWILPSLFSIILNDLLITNFKLYNNQLRNINMDNKMELHRALARMQDIHSKLTHLTTTVNSISSTTIGVSIFSCLALVCCLLYNIMRDITSDPLKMFGSVTYLSCYCLIILVIIGSCALVKMEVCSFH